MQSYREKCFTILRQFILEKQRISFYFFHERLPDDGGFLLLLIALYGFFLRCFEKKRRKKNVMSFRELRGRGTHITGSTAAPDLSQNY